MSGVRPELIPVGGYRKRRNHRAKNHVYNGWPHFATKDPGHCICLDECCQSDDGCICKLCPCKRGLSHGEFAPQIIAALEAEIEQAKERNARA